MNTYYDEYQKLEDVQHEYNPTECVISALADYRAVWTHTK